MIYLRRARKDTSRRRRDLNKISYRCRVILIAVSIADRGTWLEGWPATRCAKNFADPRCVRGILRRAWQAAERNFRVSLAVAIDYPLRILLHLSMTLRVDNRIFFMHRGLTLQGGLVELRGVEEEAGAWNSHGNPLRHEVLRRREQLHGGWRQERGTSRGALAARILAAFCFASHMGLGASCLCGY